jgi:tRNA(Arg) A34 adenosine deaminase TadA
MTSEPTQEQTLSHLRRANRIALRAVKNGQQPFGAILVGPDHATVLMEQGNVDSVNHAEATLIRNACTKFSAEYLWNCTMYTTVEPCVMCSGTFYWANIGRLVYGIAERQLLDLTGNHERNPTMDLPCREVFARGQKDIQVIGPVIESHGEILKVHVEFWK